MDSVYLALLSPRVCPVLSYCNIWHNGFWSCWSVCYYVGWSGPDSFVWIHDIWWLSNSGDSVLVLIKLPLYIYLPDEVHAAGGFSLTSLIAYQAWLVYSDVNDGCGCVLDTARPVKHPSLTFGQRVTQVEMF
jgi:hypothetical protein